MVSDLVILTLTFVFLYTTVGFILMVIPLMKSFL